MRLFNETRNVANWGCQHRTSQYVAATLTQYALCYGHDPRISGISNIKSDFYRSSVDLTDLCETLPISEFLVCPPLAPSHAFRDGSSSGKLRVHMSTGVVKWFNYSEGFGFIKPDDGSKDLFAHFSEIQPQGRAEFRTLQENQHVSFDVKRGPKGLQASNIKLA